MFSFHFQTKRQTNFGDTLYVVGNDSLLGNWDPHKGFIMKTDEKTYPIWKSDTVQTDSNKHIINTEYKYVLITKEGKVYWEEGNNRTLVNYLKITDWEFDTELKKRNTNNIQFTTHSKTIIDSIFNELFKINKVYLTIRGDMKQSQYATIIHKDFAKKKIVFKLKYNYIRKNKLQNINMPYYCITFTEDTSTIDGPFVYYLF